MSQPAPSAASRARAVASTSLIVLALILLFVSAFAVWLDREALTTPTWTDSSERLLRDPTVREPLARYLAGQLQRSVDLEPRLRAALPGSSKGLAPVAAAAIDQALPAIADAALRSPRVIALWVELNRAAHRELLATIDGNESAVTRARGVTLQLRPIVVAIATQAGYSALASRLPEATAQLVIVPPAKLDRTRKIIRGLRAASTWLALIATLAIAAGLVLSRARRRTLYLASVGIIVVGLLLLITRALASHYLPSQLARDPDGRSAVRAAWRILSAGLRDISTTMLAIGIVGTLAAWLAGPAPTAARWRRALAPTLADPRKAFGGLALVLLVLVAWGPTRATRTPASLALVGCAALVGLELLRRQVRSESAARGLDPIPDIVAPET